MHKGDPYDAVVDRRVLRAGEPDHEVPLPNENQVVLTCGASVG